MKLARSTYAIRLASKVGSCLFTNARVSALGGQHARNFRFPPGERPWPTGGSARRAACFARRETRTHAQGKLAGPERDARDALRRPDPPGINSNGETPSRRIISPEKLENSTTNSQRLIQRACRVLLRIRRVEETDERTRAAVFFYLLRRTGQRDEHRVTWRTGKQRPLARRTTNRRPGPARIASVTRRAQTASAEDKRPAADNEAIGARKHAGQTGDKTPRTLPPRRTISNNLRMTPGRDCVINVRAVRYTGATLLALVDKRRVRGFIRRGCDGTKE